MMQVASYALCISAMLCCLWIWKDETCILDACYISTFIL